MKYAIFFLLVLFPMSVRGDALQAQWGPDTKLALAQCLFAEAGAKGHKVERAAIAHVLVKRWVQLQGYRRTTLREMIVQYCSVHHASRPTRRQLAIRRMTWDGAVPASLCPGLEQVTLSRWRELLAFVSEFATGTVPDPIPAAMHYGSLRDHRKRVRTGKLGRVRLLPRTAVDPDTMKPVVLQNLFYAGAA